jgi:hypothetical protein
MYVEHATVIMIINYNRRTFVVQATLIMIVKYNCKTFTVQTTGFFDFSFLTFPSKMQPIILSAVILSTDIKPTAMLSTKCTCLCGCVWM